MKYLQAILFLFFLGGCTAAVQPSNPFSEIRTADGSVIWQDEYHFTPPPAPWRILRLDEDDYSIAFFRSCQEEPPGTIPCESIMTYAEEPFGYSRDLEERQREFFRRFLWAARVDFDEPRLEHIHAIGGSALQADSIGHERVLGHKVLVRVLFAKRDERVVAFYFTQWRPSDHPFDRDHLDDFTSFVDSFGFTQSSFYEQLLK